METSAKTGVNVELTFTAVAKYENSNSLLLFKQISFVENAAILEFSFAHFKEFHHS